MNFLLVIVWFLFFLLYFCSCCLLSLWMVSILGLLGFLEFGCYDVLMLLCVYVIEVWGLLVIYFNGFSDFYVWL